MAGQIEQNTTSRWQASPLEGLAVILMVRDGTKFKEVVLIIIITISVSITISITNASTFLDIGVTAEGKLIIGGAQFICLIVRSRKRFASGRLLVSAL